jgi:hypothetical protein
MFIVTTEVQAVILGVVDINVFSIQCVYLNNSTTEGCRYILVASVDGLNNITGTIDRSMSNEVVIKVMNIGCYGELLAYSYSRGGSNRPLPIKRKLDLQECRFNGEYGYYDNSIEKVIYADMLSS